MSLVRKTSRKPSGGRTKDDFDAIMIETRRGMSPYRRVFSQLIHIKVVSTLSDIASKTVARPNALFFGGVSSFTFTLIVYLVSKNLGYSLSGFESIASFVAGWIVGILFDVLTARKKD